MVLEEGRGSRCEKGSETGVVAVGQFGIFRISVLVRMAGSHSQKLQTTPSLYFDQA